MRPRASAPLVLAVVCSLLSGAAFLAHVQGVLRMPFFLTAIALPGTLVLGGLAIWSRGAPHAWLGQRIVGGAALGLAGTVAYDVIRWLILVTGIYQFDPFAIIHALGAMITGAPASEPLAIAAGWAYHFWNGVTFGVFYVLVFGRGRIPYAIAWALGLEVLMLLTYPEAFQFDRWNPSFVGTSVIGHLAYGVVLGVGARRLRLAHVPGRQLEVSEA